MDLLNTILESERERLIPALQGKNPLRRSVSSKGSWRKLVQVAVMATRQSLRASGLETFTSGLPVNLIAVTCTCFCFLTLFSLRQAEHDGQDLWLKY